MATLTTRVSALENDIKDVKVTLGSLDANMARLVAFLDDSQPASPATKKADAVSKPSTDKVYRSAKGKAEAKVAVDKAWAAAKGAAGVKRVKDLTPAQRAAVDAQVKAIWASVPKTRTTKA